MGPGLENVVNHQKVSLSGKNKAKTGKNNGQKSHHHVKSNNNNKGSWFYEEMKKSTAAATETGSKSNAQSSAKKTLNKNLTASYPQYHAKSKPIPVKRSISQNEVGDGKQPATRRAPSDKQHQLSRNSPLKGPFLQFCTPQQRPSSMTPPNVISQSLMSTPSSKGTPGKVFYAGAKFETHPSCMVLPPPPSHWTTPIQRSHSQPSTPTIKSAQHGTIDLASLFGSPTTKPVTMAKSFPGESLMQALEKKQVIESDSSDEELKEILSEGTEKAINKKEVVPSTTQMKDSPPRPAVNTEDLKKALGMIMVNSTSAVPKSEPESSLDLTCHGSLTPLKNFKEMSDQLKSLMKVAA